MIFCQKWPFLKAVFEAVRRDEVADFIASSCSLARDLQNAAIKSMTLSRRTASKTQNGVKKMTQNQQNRSNSA